MVCFVCFSNDKCYDTFIISACEFIHRHFNSIHNCNYTLTLTHRAKQSDLNKHCTSFEYIHIYSMLGNSDREARDEMDFKCLIRSLIKPKKCRMFGCDCVWFTIFRYFSLLNANIYSPLTKVSLTWHILFSHWNAQLLFFLVWNRMETEPMPKFTASHFM